MINEPFCFLEQQIDGFHRQCSFGDRYEFCEASTTMRENITKDFIAGFKQPDISTCHLHTSGDVSPKNCAFGPEQPVKKAKKGDVCK